MSLRAKLTRKGLKAPCATPSGLRPDFSHNLAMSSSIYGTDFAHSFHKIR